MPRSFLAVAGGRLLLATLLTATACADPATVPDFEPVLAKGKPVPATPTRLEVTPRTHVLRVGWTQQATATAYDQNGVPVSGISVKWRSTNPAVATVSKTGLVTLLSASGAATIVAETGGVLPLAGTALVRGAREGVTIAAGGSGYSWGHTCALGSVTGVASCWGSNDYSALGLGAVGDVPAYSAAPARTVGNVPLVSITSGGIFHCGLNAAGRAFCWGENAGGQGGTGSTAVGVVFEPTAVTGGHTFVSLSTSSRSAHTCGLISTGQAYCWGSNGGQILGLDPSVVFTSTPTPVPQGALRFVSTAVGGTHTCGLTQAGAAYCWGGQSDGQLGDGVVNPTAFTGTPTAVQQGSHRLVKLVLGRTFSCGLTTTGALLCWGYGSHLQTPSLPTLLNDPRRFIDVAAGDWSTCLIDAEQDVYCLGINNRGQLGAATATDFSPLPVRIASTLKFTEVTVGGLHACARTTTGAVYCWGENDRGSLGDGTLISRATPAPTLAITP